MCTGLTLVWNELDDSGMAKNWWTLQWGLLWKIQKPNRLVWRPGTLMAMVEKRLRSIITLAMCKLFFYVVTMNDLNYG